MLVDGINVKFTYSDAQKNWGKMNNDFLRLFFAFCKSQNITDVAVNSSYRSDVKGSYHFYGWGLDIYYVKYKSGKVQFFTAREKTYSISDDDTFLKSFNRFFGNYRREYISPSNILTGYKQGYNLYRNKTFREKNAELDKLKNLPYELNRNHLHHLHLAVNPDKNAKMIKIVADTGKGLLPLLVVVAIFTIKNKKILNFIKGKMT